MRGLLFAFLLLASMASATTAAYFDGEDSPGRLKDGYGGNDLIMNGTVPRPTSPTPPNSSAYWLGGAFTTTAYFTMPTATVQAIGNTIHAAFRVNYIHTGNNQSLLLIGRRTAARYLSIYVVGGTKKLGFDYTNSGGGNVTAGGSYVLTSGTSYTIDVYGSTAGVSVTVNSTWDFQRNDYPLDLGGSTLDYRDCSIGLNTFNSANVWACSSYIDEYFLSSDLGSTYPPTFASPTPTISATYTPTVTESFTHSPTGTHTVSPTWTPTATPSASPTASPTATPTATPTASPTATPTASPTATPTISATVTVTITTTPTPPPFPKPSIYTNPCLYRSLFISPVLCR